MSLFFRNRSESRSVSYQDLWGSGVPTGRGVDPLTLEPVYAATAYVADMVASLPWASFRDQGGVPEKVASQPRLVTNPGVNNLDPYSWKYQCVTSLLLHGNAYGYITGWDSRGYPTGVQWLAPSKVSVDESGTAPIFRYEGALIEPERLFHVPMYVVPGSVVGLSPVKLFKLRWETTQEAENTESKFFKRGMMPNAHLKNNEVTLNAEDAAKIRDRFVASVSSSKPFVSGKDWSLDTVTLPAGDAAFLSSIQASATMIAAIFRVAPEDIGGQTSGTSLTYKNLENDMLRFNARTIRPIATRIETVATRHLPPTKEYIKFNLDAGVRADLLTRYQAHGIAIDKKFLTVDEVRAMEERGPIPADAQEGETDA